MAGNNQGMRQSGSLPQWTALATSNTDPSESRAETPSEDEILESSQEIRDELMSSPPTLPQKRKPTFAKQASSAGPSNKANKRPRLATDKEDATGERHEPASKSDLPASAHAKPGRRPSGTTTSATQDRRKSDALINAFRIYNNRTEGDSAGPSGARQGPHSATIFSPPPRLNVAKKSTGQRTAPRRGCPPLSVSAVGSRPSTSMTAQTAPKSKSLRPPSSTQQAHPQADGPAHGNEGALKRLLLKPQEKSNPTTDLLKKAERPPLKDRERRKTLPSTNPKNADIDLTISDDDPPPAQSKKPTFASKVVNTIEVQSKKYGLQGKADNPIVLTDSDDDASPPPPLPPPPQRNRSNTAPSAIAKAVEVIELDESEPEQAMDAEPQDTFAGPDEFGLRDSPRPVSVEPAVTAPAAEVNEPTYSVQGTQDRQPIVSEPPEPETPNVDTIVPAMDHMAVSPAPHASSPESATGTRSPASSSRQPDPATATSIFSQWETRDGSKSGLVSRSSTEQFQDLEPLLGQAADAMDLDAMDVDPPPQPEPASPTPPVQAPSPLQVSPSVLKSPVVTPSSPPSGSHGPSIARTLFSGRGGFFRDVHKRRDERQSSASHSPPKVQSPLQAQSTPKTQSPSQAQSLRMQFPNVQSPLQIQSPLPVKLLLKMQSPSIPPSSQAGPSTAQRFASSPTSSLHNSAAPSPDAGASSGHEVPPSSAEVSLSGSVEPQPQLQPQTREDSIPLAPPAAPESDPTVMQDRSSTAPAPAPQRAVAGTKSLKQSVNEASFKVAEAMGDVIDLTMSDDEDEPQPIVWSDGNDVDAITDALADLRPEIFNATALAAAPTSVASAPISAVEPVVSRPAPSLSTIRALQKKPVSSADSQSAGSSSGGDSFPVSRRSSLGIPVPPAHITQTVSEEDVPLADASRGSSARPSGSASDSMAVDEDSDDPLTRIRRRGRPRKSRAVSSPTRSADDSDANDELEAARLLLHNADDSLITRRLRPRQQTNQAGILGHATRNSSASSSAANAQPAAGPSRIPLRRNGATEEAIVPAMDNVHIYDDSDSDDDPEGYTITWNKNGRRLALEYADVHLRARDLPFNLQNRMMSLPLQVRQADGLQRKVFKSMISVGTVDDEPYAPEINIINDVDNELSPPFEFHYTNKIYHGKNVPGPDVYGLEGCDCIGPCDPSRSSTCPCVKRQMEYMEKAVEEKFERGFAYGPDGRIRTEHIEYPIFECNAACRCDDEDCRNRVVQKGRKVKIDIKKTVNKGWGVFAGQSIPKNTFIGIYAGEYLTDEEGTDRGSMYDEFGRTYLFDIDFWHLRQEPHWHGKSEDWETKFCVDAFHAGNFTRFLNHSCDPNCVIVAVYINEANIDKPLLTIWSCKDVTAGEELCFSYVGDPDDLPKLTDKERAHLQAIHAICQCGTRKCKGRMWRIAPDPSSRASSEE